MQYLAAFFVARPLAILAVSVVFLAGFLARLLTITGGSRHARPLLIASIAWALYAGWEYWIQRTSPEANIRVDLLAIWPLLAALSLWAVFRSIRPARSKNDH